jgi:Cu/Zn superoxide dismutase
MHPNRIIALTLALTSAGFVAACDNDRDEVPETTPATEEAQQTPPRPMGEPGITGEFERVQGAPEGISGNFELRAEQAGGSTLTATLSGLTPGEHAWHIHSGACGSAGPVAIALTPVPGSQAVAGAQALVAGADGRAQASVTIPQAELDRLQATGATGTVPPAGAAPQPAPAAAPQFSINVHQQGGANPGAMVACANLDLLPGASKATKSVPTY